MSEFPRVPVQHGAIPITVSGLTCNGVVPNLSSSVGDNTWPSANRALFSLIKFEEAVRVIQAVAVFAVASGNIDVGVYDLGGRRIVSSGSTVMGASPQTISLAATSLPAGYYYLGVAIDNTTASIKSQTGFTVSKCRLLGSVKQDAAFPLPATATFATYTDAYMPAIAISLRSIV